MKKTYLVPATKVESAVVEQMIAASITQVGGDSNLQIGTGETPTNADVKESDNFWDGEW